jgi:hypothetical protein
VDISTHRFNWSGWSLILERILFRLTRRLFFQRFLLLFVHPTMARAQFDQCDRWKKNEGAAQSKASNESNLLRLGNGRTPHVPNVNLMFRYAVFLLSVPLELTF